LKTEDVAGLIENIKEIHQDIDEADSSNAIASRLSERVEKTDAKFKQLIQEKTYIVFAGTEGQGKTHAANELIVARKRFPKATNEANPDGSWGLLPLPTSWNSSSSNENPQKPSNKPITAFNLHIEYADDDVWKIYLQTCTESEYRDRCRGRPLPRDHTWTFNNKKFGFDALTHVASAVSEEDLSYRLGEIQERLSNNQSLADAVNNLNVTGRCDLPSNCVIVDTVGLNSNDFRAKLVCKEIDKADVLAIFTSGRIFSSSDIEWLEKRGLFENLYRDKYPILMRITNNGVNAGDLEAQRQRLLESEDNPDILSSLYNSDYMTRRNILHYLAKGAMLVDPHDIQVDVEAFWSDLLDRVRSKNLIDIVRGACGYVFTLLARETDSAKIKQYKDLFEKDIKRFIDHKEFNTVLDNNKQAFGEDMLRICNTAKLRASFNLNIEADQEIEASFESDVRRVTASYVADTLQTHIRFARSLWSAQLQLTFKNKNQNEDFYNSMVIGFTQLERTIHKQETEQQLKQDSRLQTELRGMVDRNYTEHQRFVERMKALLADLIKERSIQDLYVRGLRKVFDENLQSIEKIPADIKKKATELRDTWKKYLNDHWLDANDRRIKPTVQNKKFSVLHVGDEELHPPTQEIIGGACAEISAQVSKIPLRPKSKYIPLRLSSLTELTPN